MSQRYRELPCPGSEEFRRAFAKDWQEHVLSTLGLRRFSASPVEETFVPSEDEMDGVTGDGARPAPSGPSPEITPLELPELQPAPFTPASVPATPLPLPSPMLEVPATPTPSESPRLRPMTSPMTTPMASPMWQPLSEAFLPTPQLRADAGGAMAPPTPMSIFAEAPKGGPSTEATPSPKLPLDLPQEDPGSAALFRLLWPSETLAVETPKPPAAGVLKTLFRMPDFHSILLEGIGLPEPPVTSKSRESQSFSSTKRKFDGDTGRRIRDDNLGEPYAKRYRHIWEILSPIPSQASSTSASASSPPKVSRYGKLRHTESSLFDPTRSLFDRTRNTQMTQPLHIAHPEHTVPEKRKRLAHSEITRYLWGRVVKPARDRKTKIKPIKAKVLPPLVSKKTWPGKSPPTAQELSLRGGQPFVLYEYIEEHPTLLMNAGMGHEVLSYFSPRKKTYEGEALGPLQSKTPTQINGPLPHLLGSQIMLKPGQGVAVIDSAVLQAPLASHKLNGNRFLLVWSKKEGSRQTDLAELHLRPLSLACVVGQVEPKGVEPKSAVPFPSSESKSMGANCLRHMLHQAWQRWQKDFSGELEDEDEDGIQKAMVKDISGSVLPWFPDQSPLVHAELRDMKSVLKKLENFDLPECVCRLEAMYRGEDRLESLGIGNLQADATLIKALQDLEFLERRRGAKDDLQILRGRWVLEQLQITPWNLAKQLQIFKKKDNLPAIAGPGDPSNGRLEGVSFLPLLAKHAGECLALSKLCFKADKDIVAKLQQLGVSQDSYDPLTRWDRIALLCSKLGGDLEKNSDCFVTGWSRSSLSQTKQSSAEHKKQQPQRKQLLQDAFQRQMLALTNREATGPDQLTLGHGEAIEGPGGLQKEVDQDDEAALIEALEDSPEKDEDADAIRLSLPSDGEDDKMEMQRLRQQLGKAQPVAASSIQSAAPDMASITAKSAGAEDKKDGPTGKVKMLKVLTITLGKTGQVQERALYVFGEENIRLYREMHAANDLGPMGPMGPTGRMGLGPGPSRRGPGSGPGRGKSRVESNVSKVSKGSDQSKDKSPSKGKSKDERVSSRTANESPALKALGGKLLKRRRKQSDVASKASKLSE